MNIKEIGACIYLCEGTKERIDNRGKVERRIEVCNTNSKVIIYFLFYLRSFITMDEKKLRARLFLHKGDNEMEAKKYWSKITKIPLSQFVKIQWREPSGWRKNRLPYGTIAIRYYDTSIFKEIMKDIAYYFSLDSRGF